MLARRPQFTVLVGALAAASILSSCDVDLFGTDAKMLAAGYRLLRTENPHDCALSSPGESGGTVVGEIGLRQPFIIARGWHAKQWLVFDTTTNQRSIITEEERAGDPRFRDIQTHDAMDAWQKLERDRGVW